jgi:methyltransferase
VIEALIILSLVTLQRLAELVIARRNTRRLLQQGGQETGASHYPAIVGLHFSWLAILWWLAPGQPVSWPLIGLFLLLQLGRIWVLAAMGPRWTTRIIVVPGESLVRTGPFRILRHPNYSIVAAELAILPLAFGLWPVALLFSLLNAAILFVRIRAEEEALGLNR